MAANEFFHAPDGRSVVKAEIVSKYFGAWANVIKGSVRAHGGKMGYIDLFAGPGRYNDGTESTPLMVARRTVEDPDLLEMLVLAFNDADPKNVDRLQEELSQIEGIAGLRHKPLILNEEVDTNLAEELGEMKLIPSLVFVDPWGYRGVTQDLIASLIKDWGCDCILFFNYTRINMAINNPMVAGHVDALFGEERAEDLRSRVGGMDPTEREAAVVEEMAEAIGDMGGKYVLPFCFKSAGGSRTSHHLMFVSKHVRGYEIMKEIMARYSSEATQEVPGFVYTPVTSREYPLLFDLSRPLDDLADMLLEEFEGKRMRMEEVYHRHHVGKPYVKRNYKAALVSLERAGRIEANPPLQDRPRRRGDPTFADHVVVCFPPED